jgi:hypothetical protein
MSLRPDELWEVNHAERIAEQIKRQGGSVDHILAETVPSLEQRARMKVIIERALSNPPKTIVETSKTDVDGLETETEVSVTVGPKVAEPPAEEPVPDTGEPIPDTGQAAGEAAADRAAEREEDAREEATQDRAEAKVAPVPKKKAK